MFAMRACRKSVMVGMPLTKGQMTTVCAQLLLASFRPNHYSSDRTSHGHDGSTMELSSRTTYDAASV